MGRSQETYNKKEVRNKKEKKRKEKEKKRLEKKDGKKNNPDDMIAYVDQFGRLSSTPPDPNQKTSPKAEDIEISIPKRAAEEAEDPVRKGRVTYFNEAKGYGFIKDTVTQESVFVHINNTIDTIREGNQVSFEVENGKKGPAAVAVKLDKTS